MQERSFWASWSMFLRRHHLVEPAAVILDSLGPLRLFAAQMIYFTAPIAAGGRQGGEWQALAELLEDPEESRSFITFLREGDQT